MLKNAGNKFKASLLGLAAIGFLGGSINLVYADTVVSNQNIRGLSTFRDTNTGYIWLKLNNFFSQSVNQMLVQANSAGFTLATTAQVNGLLNGLPLTSNQWSSYASVMGRAPNRGLIWGAYNSQSVNSSWAYAYDSDTTWTYTDSLGFDDDGIPNAGSDEAELNLWALMTDTFYFDTQFSLEQSASILRGVYSLQNALINNNLNNDCTLFDSRGICVSLSGTQTDIAGGGFEGTNGTLTVAYRVNNNLRIGTYLDQRLNVNNVAGVQLNNGSPGFGGFGVWNQHEDGYGAQIRVAAGYDDKDMTITRQVIYSSEAGTGKTNLTSYGASVVGSYAMLMPGDITFSPYAGLRYTKVKAGAYAESDSVADPLTYRALTKNETTALIGAKWSTRITDNAIAYASLGIEQDLKNNGGTYTATGVDGLTSIAFNPDISRTRRTASIGSYYNLGDTQRIGATLAWSEQAFTSIDATSLMVTYTAGF
jgi:hypothetical protein